MGEGGQVVMAAEMNDDNDDDDPLSLLFRPSFVRCAPLGPFPGIVFSSSHIHGRHHETMKN